MFRLNRNCYSSLLSSQRVHCTTSRHISAPRGAVIIPILPSSSSFFHTCHKATLDRYKIVVKQPHNNTSEPGDTKQQQQQQQQQQQPVIQHKFNNNIPREKLQFSFARSSGPGGQNVNKVNTKVDLRFHVDSADWIPKEVKERLKELYATKINKQGELIIQASVHRTQSDNMEDAVERLREYLRAAYEPVQVMEHELGRSEKSDRERIQKKKMNSDKKKARQGKGSGHWG